MSPLIRFRKTGFARCDNRRRHRPERPTTDRQIFGRNHGEPVMSKENRSHVRRSTVQRARIEALDGSFLGECTMIGVSAGGARVVLATPDPLPSRFFLILSHDGALRRLCQPVWQTETRAAQFIFE